MPQNELSDQSKFLNDRHTSFKSKITFLGWRRTVRLCFNQYDLKFAWWRL